MTLQIVNQISEPQHVGSHFSFKCSQTTGIRYKKKSSIIVIVYKTNTKRKKKHTTYSHSSQEPADELKSPTSAPLYFM